MEGKVRPRASTDVRRQGIHWLPVKMKFKTKASLGTDLQLQIRVLHELHKYSHTQKVKKMNGGFKGWKVRK